MIDKRLGTSEDRRLAAERETFAMLTGIFEAARIIPAQFDMPDVKLPLTVISGFLGAGKTTLVNRLLTEPHGRRIAVLVNDFGDVNIDEELIKSRSANAIGLTNGCACCSVAGDLTKALMRLVMEERPPDAIVLEASGLADPHGIAQVALANPAIRLDGVLTLVDGETFLGRIDDAASGATIVAQVAAADLIVVNKTDLMNGQRAGVLARLREIAPERAVIEVCQANVPADIVLGINADHTAFQCAAEGHSSPFKSWTRSWDAPLNRSKLENALKRLPPDVIRAKGVMHFDADLSKRFVFHRVGQRDELVAEPNASDSLRSRLVVIGPALSWDEITLEDIFAEVA